MSPWDKIKSFFWGLFVFEFYRETRREQTRHRDALHLVLFGSFLGLPILSLPYTLRLLPHLFGDLRGWRERQLKDEDPLDHPPDLH
jgi:hypothetical protein